MSEASRWVVIDDRDSRVQYSGSWTATNGDAYNGYGNFGQVYLNTLHGTTTSSSLSFTFNGNAARIMGSNDLTFDAADSPDPEWECVVDGTTVNRENAFKDRENNWVFCKFYELSDGQHTITLNVKTKGQAFWFDQIQYHPTGTVSNEVVSISRNDADFQYDGTWQPLAEVAYFTDTNGGTVTFPFVGSRLSLWAMYPHELSKNSGEASYTLDGGFPIAFTIQGGGDGTEYNRKIFETPNLSQGAHTLTMTYGSGTKSDHTPLVISNLLIEGGTNQRAPKSSNSSPPSGSPSSGTGSTGSGSLPGTNTGSGNTTASNTVYKAFATKSGSNGHSLPTDSSGGPSGGTNGTALGGSSGISKNALIGAIVGGVLGLLALTALIIWLLWYKRRRQIRLEDGNAAGTQTFDPNPMASPDHSIPVTVQGQNIVGASSQPPTPAQPLLFYTPTPSANSSSNLLPQRIPVLSSEQISSGVFMHQDSGVRMPVGPPALVEDPPMYTPS